MIWLVLIIIVCLSIFVWYYFNQSDSSKKVLKTKRPKYIFIVGRNYRIVKYNFKQLQSIVKGSVFDYELRRNFEIRIDDRLIIKGISQNSGREYFLGYPRDSEYLIVGPPIDHRIRKELEMRYNKNESLKEVLEKDG